MALTDDLSTKDMEHRKFKEQPTGDISVKTCIVNDVTIPVPVAGAFSVSGLTIGLEITNTTVTSTAATVPATALTDRNSIIIFNTSSTDTIYIGNSDVTSSGVKEGWIVDPGSYFSVDITESISLFAISSVASVSVKIMEFA